MHSRDESSVFPIIIASLQPVTVPYRVYFYSLFGFTEKWQFYAKKTSIWTRYCTICSTKKMEQVLENFFSGGIGIPPVGKNLVNTPIRHSSPFSNQSLSPSTLTFVSENFYNFSTFLFWFCLLLSLKLPLKVVFHA